MHMHTYLPKKCHEFDYNLYLFDNSSFYLYITLPCYKLSNEKLYIELFCLYLLVQTG